MDFKKNEHITMLFERLNGRKKAGDEPASELEAKKLKYFWDECSPPKFDSSSIIEKTRQKIRADRLKRSRRSILAASLAAASVLFFVTDMFLLKGRNDTVSDLQTVIQGIDEQVVENITLIVEERKLNLEEGAMVSYTKEGKIAVNSTEVEEVNDTKAKNEQKTEYNTLLVPAGKRASIELSDGTKLTVNALSKVVYPRQFAKNIREIYVKGEVFLDVAHDEERPFTVTTDDFDLRVLGTRFNISNYKNLGVATVVLVQGSVEVTDKKENKTVLHPNDLLSIAGGTIIAQRQVDVTSHICWVDGLLILNGQSLTHILQKLNIYYGTDIECVPAVADKKMYGKLDLKDNLTEVLLVMDDIITRETGRDGSAIWLNQ